MSKSLKNVCGKTRPVDKPYEIWEGQDGTEFRVLKKYQAPDKEATNAYARWFLSTTTGVVKGELGDGYVRTVKQNARRTFADPIVLAQEEEMKNAS